MFDPNDYLPEDGYDDFVNSDDEDFVGDYDFDDSVDEAQEWYDFDPDA